MYKHNNIISTIVYDAKIPKKWMMRLQHDIRLAMTSYYILSSIFPSRPLPTMAQTWVKENLGPHERQGMNEKEEMYNQIMFKLLNLCLNKHSLIASFEGLKMIMNDIK